MTIQVPCCYFQFMNFVVRYTGFVVIIFMISFGIGIDVFVMSIDMVHDPGWVGIPMAPYSAASTTWNRITDE